MINRRRPSKQIIACIMVMIFILLAFFSFTRENEQRIMEQNMGYIQDSTIQIAGQIDQVFSDGYANIRIMSAFVSQSLDRPEVDIDLVRELAEDSVFDFLEFADKDGMDHNITGGVSDARDRKYYLDGMKGNVGLEVIFNSRATHETLLMFYSPVTFEGENVGVLIGVYQASNKLAKMLDITYFGESANLYLCTPEGRVAASNLPLDTNEELYVTDLAEGNEKLSDSMYQAMQSGQSLNFTLETQKSGGCMTKLKSDWYLIQVFPEAANVTMVQEANNAGIRLETMLLLIFGVVLVVMVHFYRKEQQTIAEVAEERGEYKNAVLADAIIVFEANMTRNQIQEGIWKNRDGSRRPLEEVLGLELPCDYDTYIVRWADTYVDEGSRTLFLEYTGREYLNKQFEQGKSEITFEYYARSLEGEKIFVRRSTYLAVDKKSGDIIAYNNVKDITDQKQKENQMHRYEQMLIMTASGMHQGAWQVDLSDFSTVYLSFEDNHITPWEKEDWSVWFARQERYIHQDDIEKVREKLSAANLLKMPVAEKFRCDFRSRERNESGIHRMYSASAYKTELDGKLYVSLITMDNTAAMENEMKQKALIEDALLRAENASKAKTKFLFNMSHDIRTPMNAIIGFTTLAIRHADDAERVRGYLKKIADSGNHLLSLINDVLDMSRIENGKVQLEETEYSLSEVVQELQNMLLLEVQSRNLKLYIEMEDVTDDKVIGDRLRLKQILQNLLGNAVKFTNSGGRIWVKVMERPGRDKTIYEFRVKDTGIGMSEEFLKRVFEPFERERTSTVSGVQGTGLGMAITRNLVEMMEGTISVTSKKGEGTEFIVQLPMKPFMGEQQETVHVEKENTHEISMTMKGRRVLLVEDNDLNREIAGEILSEAGLLVEEANDGSIAVEKLLEQGPGYYSLVLMDVQMPVMDGYTATRTIRSFDNKELASIPIIAMTANAFDEDKKEAFANGMNAHVAKPIDVKLLLKEMEAVME
ncbi:ATP-binding protein [Roseburia hominis]